MIAPMEPEHLLSWYDCHRRDLPWRRTRDPYRIWISEIMLQQTQVQTVLPYYRDFLARFPAVEALAASDVEDVLALWSGLGYYRRARQLHRAAVEIVSRGEFPRTVEGLQELPGIGPYTAAAVASIAFGEVAAVLDGNVERLLCRRLAWSEDPKRAASRRRLLAAAGELLDPERPGDSNQALMELGATVCRPVNPECGRCPLAEGCRAREQGTPQLYPVPRPRRQVERHHLAVAVVRDQKRILFFRRPEDSEILPGMWELPNVPRSSRATLKSLSVAFSEHYGGHWRLTSTAVRVRHGVTYRSLVLYVYEGEIRVEKDSVAEGPEAAWVGDQERERFPTSSMVEKVLRALSFPER